MKKFKKAMEAFFLFSMCAPLSYAQVIVQASYCVIAHLAFTQVVKFDIISYIQKAQCCCCFLPSSNSRFNALSIYAQMLRIHTEYHPMFLLHCTRHRGGFNEGALQKEYSMRLSTQLMQSANRSQDVKSKWQ